MPVIVEDREVVEGNVQRGRLPTGGQQMDPSARSRLSDTEGRLPTYNGSSSNPHSVAPHQQHSGAQPFSSSLGPNVPGQQTGRRQSPGAFGMSGMAGALPDYQASFYEQMSHQDQQRFLAGASSSTSTYPNQQFPGQSPMHVSNFPHHTSQYASTYQQGYPVPQSPQSHPGGLGSSYTTGSYLPAQQQQYMYYPGQYAQGIQTHLESFPSPFGPGSYPQQTADLSMISGRLAGYPSGTPSSYAYGSGGAYPRAGGMPVVRRESSNSRTGSIPSTPRGPPRKPKQSGYALWVGNLPSGTVISDLKDHFSRDATKDIESVFLISKSNCAFVNYRTEDTCAAAMKRFHDSRFQGVRLVCRLRSNSAVAAASKSGTVIGPAAPPALAYSQTAFEAIQQNREVISSREASAESQRAVEPSAKVTDKYFVMKSLTVEDMELSVRNSIWATQSHNEEALNKAYENSENVYLIFSANKSGEYFGFARMASPITDEAAAGLDWAPRGETVIDDPDIPRSIPTAPTEFAPKGRIIDDSARGTIFWEADPEDGELAPIIDPDVDEPGELQKAEEADDAEEGALTGEAQAFGKPFKIEWIATNRLPFYRTRGLRNPWNANREVKIARDGTEIETTVGRRLIQMFQKPPSPGVPQQPVGWSPGQVY